MRGVHVDQHQAVAVLREHVDAMQLRQREAERMLIGIGQFGTAGAGRRRTLAKQPLIEGGGLGGRQPHRRLHGAL